MQISQFYLKRSCLFWGIILYILIPGTTFFLKGQTTSESVKASEPLEIRLQDIISQADPSRQFPTLLGLARVYSERMNPFTVQYINAQLENVLPGDSIIPAAVHFLIGEFLNVNLQDFDTALRHYQLALAQVPAQAEELRMRILDRVSGLSLNNFNLEEALPAAETCIALARQLSKPFSLGHCQMCLGEIQRDFFHNPKGGSSYFQSALDNFSQSFQRNITAKDTLATLLNLFFITSLKLEIDSGFQDGIVYLETASPFITTDEKYDDFRAQITYLYGRFLAKNGNYTAALDTFHKAYQQFTITEDTARMMQTRYLTADALYQRGQADEAITYLNEALLLAPSVASVDELEDIYNLLYLSAKETGDVVTALSAHEAYVAANRQVYQEDQQRFIRGLEAQNELRNKQVEIDQQQQEITQKSINNKKLTLSIILLAILLSLLLFSFIRARNNRNELRTRNAIIIKQKQQLEELDNLKSEFFANISHELKTPLALIKAPLEYLQKKHTISEGGGFFLDTALKNTNRLESLVKELLDISKIESGNNRLNLKTYDLQMLMEQNIESFKPLAQTKNIELGFQRSKPFPIVAWADQAALQKILTNLLSNAIKFSEPGSEVRVSLAVKDDHAVVSVDDQGPGIYPDDLPHIFNRFHQSRHKDVHRSNSTGIGLSLSAELARQMDGKLSVESERGKGSRFFLTLPLAKATDLVDLAPDASGEKGLQDTRDVFREMDTLKKSAYHILVVEDHENLREYLAKLLGEYFKVYTASNGEEAITFISSPNCPLLQPGRGLIISDLMMPVMDGFDLLEKLKQNEKYQGIPVIMLTARQERSQRLKALRVGVDDYLVKPFDNQELLIRVKNLILRHEEKVKQFSVIGDSQPDENSPKGIGQNHQPLDTEQLQWLKELEAYAIKHIADNQFNVSFLSNYANMSERNFLRHIKKATGLTPSEYIKEIRLHHARQLLESGKVKSVKAVSKAVGFNSQEYFSDIFHNRFGRRPSTYLG